MIKAYLEHLLTTTLAMGESSVIQVIFPEDDLLISSISSLNEFRFPTNHLNDPSLTKSSSIFRVLLAIAIFASESPITTSSILLAKTQLLSIPPNLHS